MLLALFEFLQTSRVDPWLDFRTAKSMNKFFYNRATVASRFANVQRPVVRSLVSANCWLRGIKTYRFPWYLTLFSANYASSNATRASLRTY